jgi:signal peptidase I
MEPRLESADRIMVNKIGVASSLQRGDLVVFGGTHTFADRAAGTGSEQGSWVSWVFAAMTSIVFISIIASDDVQRVVGLPGDHVMCCDDQWPPDRQRHRSPGALPLSA